MQAKQYGVAKIDPMGFGVVRHTWPLVVQARAHILPKDN